MATKKSTSTAAIKKNHPFKVIENQTNPPKIMDELVGLSAQDTLDQVDSLIAYIEWEMLQGEEHEDIPDDAADGKQYAKRVLIGAARNALQKQCKQLGDGRAAFSRIGELVEEARHD